MDCFASLAMTNWIDWTGEEQTVLGETGRSARSFAIILIVHLAVILFWQLAVDAFQVPKFILPSPLAALSTLAYAKYAWISNMLVTAAEILGGFALGQRRLSLSRWPAEQPLEFP